MPDIDAVDLTVLRSFLAVARTNSVSGAARHLGLSQPAVSQHIRRLETALGVPLLHRSSRPVGLTDAARTLAHDLPQVIKTLDAVLARASARRDSPRDSLRVAMPDSLSCILGAEFLASSRQLARRLELRAGISPWIEDALRTGRCDIAIDCPPFDPQIRTQRLPLFHDPYVIVTPKQMAGLPLGQVIRDKSQVAFGRTSKFGTATAAIAQQMGATQQAQFNFDSTHSLLRFVQAGYGWAVTSAVCLLQSPSALRDLQVHSCAPDQKRSFYLFGSRDTPPDVAASFADRLVAVFRLLLDERWTEISPAVVALIRNANPGV